MLHVVLQRYPLFEPIYIYFLYSYRIAHMNTPVWVFHNIMCTALPHTRIGQMSNNMQIATYINKAWPDYSYMNVASCLFKLKVC